jgi:hypothetical protein
MQLLPAVERKAFSQQTNAVLASLFRLKNSDAENYMTTQCRSILDFVLSVLNSSVPPKENHGSVFGAYSLFDWCWRTGAAILRSIFIVVRELSVDRLPAVPNSITRESSRAFVLALIKM